MVRGEHAQLALPWAAIFAAWVLSLGIDLFLHAGVLAGLYVEPSPFLLPAAEAFRRIPAGYPAFPVLTVALQSVGWVPPMAVTS